MRVHFQNKTKSAKLSKLWVRTQVELLTRSLANENQRFKQLAKLEISIIILGESKAKKINLNFRDRNYATDVLSFDPIEESSLGELVFCGPVIGRQAKEHDLTFKEEFLYLLIHGVLHLLGYNHENGGRQAKRMYALQEKLFERLRSSS